MSRRSGLVSSVAKPSSTGTPIHELLLVREPAPQQPSVSLALPVGRPRALRTTAERFELAEGADGAPTFEVVDARGRLALVVHAPGAQAPGASANGLPLPLLHVARPGERLVLADGTALCLVERLAPYVGPAPAALAGATCVTCLTAIDEGARVVACARCRAVQHAEDDPAIPADDRLACASLAPHCPSCSEPLEAREVPDVAD